MRSIDRPFWVGLAVAAVAMPLQFGTPPDLAAQGMRYVAQPGVSWVQWDDALGLADVRLNGGSAGIGFGRYVSLRGYYLTKDQLSTGFESLSFTDPIGSPLGNQNFDLTDYGGELTVGLGAGTIVPVLMGGGGILKLQPELGLQQKRITVKYGAGVRAYLSESLELEVMVERNQFRLDPLDLAIAPAEGDPALPTNDDADGIRRNLAVRVGLGFQLGSRDFARGSELDQAVEGRYQRPFSDLAISLQPFVGRQQFDDALGFADRDVAGFTGGLDFGSFVGLRGFYWKGVNDDFDAFEGLVGYGAEAQFNLTDGQGMAPYLLAGAGQMNFEGDFDSIPGQIPADQKAVILGGGIDFNFGSRIRLSATARNYLMAGNDFLAGGDLEQVSTPDDITHNWQFTGGIKLLVGGGRGIGVDRPAPDFPPAGTLVPVRIGSQGDAEPAPPTTVEPSTEMVLLVERMEAAAVRAEEAARRSEESAQAGRAPEATAAGAAAMAQPHPTETATGWPTPAGSALSPQPVAAGSPYGPVVIVPMPWPMPWGQPLAAAPASSPSESAAAATGGAGGLTAEELREFIRAEMARGRTEEEAAVQPRAPEPGLTAQDLAAMEARLGERMNAALERERKITEEIARQEADAAVARRVRDEPVESIPTLEVRDEAASADEARAGVESEAPGARRIRLDPSLGFPVREIRPFSGMTVGQGSQMVLGISADWGPFRSAPRFDLVPEVSVAFGAGHPTWMAVANLQYRTGWVFERDSFWINPLVQAGPGLLNRDGFEAVVNVAYGATIQLSGIRSREGRPLNLFVAHQGIDLFDRSSLILGLSLER